LHKEDIIILREQKYLGLLDCSQLYLFPPFRFNMSFVFPHGKHHPDEHFILMAGNNPVRINHLKDKAKYIDQAAFPDRTRFRHALTLIGSITVVIPTH